MAIYFICFLLFFMFPDICKDGMTGGIRLLAFQVIPSLYPFMLIASLIRTAPIPARLSRIYPIVCGFISGYPMGAKAVVDMKSGGHIGKEQAEALLILCNNPGPAFIVSYAAMGMLEDITLGPLIWAAALSGSFLACLCMCFIRRKNEVAVPSVSMTSVPVPPSGNFFDTLEQAAADTLNTLFTISGNVLIFSVLSEFIQQAAFIPDKLCILASGILEMTCGIRLAAASDMTLAWKVGSITVFSVFGGLSIISQTAGIIRKEKLSIKKYITGKALAACFAFPVIHLLLCIFH